MDTPGTINSDFGAIEEAERQLRSIGNRLRDNPDLRGAEEDDALAERLERWLPDLGLPRFRSTCLPELRSYRANQLRQEGRGRTTTKVPIKIPDTLMRQIHTIAEKNPHLFNDSKEFIDDFALLGINMGLYIFRHFPGEEDVVDPLSWEDEEIFKSLYRETQRMKILVMFEEHCKRAQLEAVHLEDTLKIANSMKRVTDFIMEQAVRFMDKYPYMKVQFLEVVEKYFGPQSIKKYRDKQRKREERGSQLAEKEDDPTLDLSKRHLSLVTTVGSA